MTDPIRNRGLDLLPAAAWQTVNQDALAGRTLFITGATGFVGRWVLAAIARLNERMSKPLAVRALTRGEMPVEAPWLTWEVAEDVAQLNVHGPADLILHAAMSSSATPPGGEGDLVRVGLAGQSAVNSRAVFADARRVVLLSSGSVYGTAYAPLPESSPLAELDKGDIYGLVKRQVEDLSQQWASTGGFDLVIARLFTCIGHGYRKHSHLAHVSMLDDARAGKPIVLRSDGSAIRSYIFGADLAIWLLAMLSAKGSDVVNVGSDEQISMLDFAKIIARVAGRGDDAVVVKGTDPVVRPVFVPDISRAKSLYGVAAWTNVETAIADALKDR